jgi:hypothetical protein
MKKNMLFSIALCLGLMLPGISFGAEVSQASWFGRLTGAFSSTNETIQNYLSGWATSLVSRLNDGQKKALYAALAVALLGTVSYAAYSRSQGSTQEESTGPYKGLAIDRTNLYTQNNMQNVAQFLYNEQYTWEKYKNKDFFQNHVLPVLNLLELPKKPFFDPAMEPTYHHEHQDSAKKYRQNVATFWNGFMHKVANGGHSISLPEKNETYLEIIYSYLRDNTPLKKSLNDALFTLTGEEKYKAQAFANH